MARLDLDAINAAVAARTGASDPGAVRLLKQGAVFEVDDKLVKFVESSDAWRTWHAFRRVIVVQGDHLLGPVEPATVLVVPCSASQTAARRADFAIPDDEPGFTRPNVVAYASMVMPAPKTALTPEGFKGQLRDETLGRLLAQIVKNLGLESSR